MSFHPFRRMPVPSRRTVGWAILALLCWGAARSQTGGVPALTAVEPGPQVAAGEASAGEDVRGGLANDARHRSALWQTVDHEFRRETPASAPAWRLTEQSRAELREQVRRNAEPAALYRVGSPAGAGGSRR